MNDGEIIIETSLDTKTFNKQYEKLKAELDRYMKVLESDAQVPVSLRMSAEEKRNLEATIEKTRNQLISLQEQAQRTGEVGEEAGERSGRGFEKGITSLKRFALSLFGIRSMFSLVRRATSTYLSQNETTANKINAIWVALGNALAPIIEAIADGVLKLIGYLNVFLNALGFNVDLTKNMNKTTKAVNSTTKAMKELNKQTASFDEMNIQSKETSSSGSGGTSGTNGFTMPELDEGVVKRLQDVAYWLKENKGLLFAIGTIIAGYKVLKWLSGLSSIIGGGTGAGATGLLGLTNILKGLLAFELIAITISVIYFGMQLNELKKTNDEIERFYNNNTKNAKEVNKNNREMVETTEKGSKAIEDYVYELNEQVKSSKNSIDAKKKENDEIGITGRLLESVSGTRKKNNEIIKEQIQRIINNATELQNLAKQGKLTDDQMKVYNDTMKYLDETQKDLSEDIKYNIMTYGDQGEAISKTQIELGNQIQALKDADKESGISTKHQKDNVIDLADTTREVIGGLNGVVAKPKVEVQTNTKKLQDLLEIFNQNKNVLSATGVVAGASGVLAKIKSLGLKSGGIFYNPGKGVSVSDVRIGEGTGQPEGVVPMNNEQSMALIGESIAKHVVINLTSTTMLDNKVIAREQRKITDNTNFATNGRGVL